TRSPDGCVWAFSMTEYRRIISDILTAGAVSPETRILHRYLTSYAYIIPEPDSYTRLRLSQEIRNLVYGESASKDLLLKGGGNLVELWSVDRWTDYLKSFSDV